MHKKLVLFVFLCAPLVTEALDNKWISPSSGHWEDASWSLGVRPGANQSINITNGGYKAVQISSSTISGYPQTLTISNLYVAAPTNGLSTLLLNYTGLNVPLRVTDGCAIGAQGTLMNMYSSLEVDGSAGDSFAIAGGQFIQEGGFTVASNLSITITGGGSLNATNAAISLGAVSVGYYANGGEFNQSGGSIACASLAVSAGSYNLYGGVLYALGGTSLGGAQHSTFTQFGGTNYGDINAGNGIYRLLGGLVKGDNISAQSYMGGSGPNGFCQDDGKVQTASLSVSGGAYNTVPGYSLTNGLLWTGTLSIPGGGVFEQVGGQHVVTNGFTLAGYDYTVPHTGTYVYTSIYSMLGGVLNCPSITIGRYGSFTQSGGTNVLSGDLALTGSSGYRSCQLSGNSFLETANSVIGFGTVFYQEGGIHYVNGVLSISGSYRISGGDVSCGGMWMHGRLSILSTNGTSTVSCPGLLDLGGTVEINSGNHHLGPVRLNDNSFLNFGSAPATINFAASSSLLWSNGISLTISNWSGQMPNHIFFGNDSSALTGPQLAQIKFLNPGSMGGGIYNATILNTGEVVPSGTARLLTGWGGSGYYQPNYGPYSFPAIASNAIAISVRRDHSVALLADGSVLSTDGSTIGSDLVAVAAGLAHTVGLRSNSTVIAWGDNSQGESSVPDGLSNVVAIAAGDYHSMALRADGTIVVWGENDSNLLYPPPSATPAIAIAAGSYHNLALRADGTVVAWGNNTSGQTNVPAGLSNVVAICGGYFFNLALKADGGVVGWGVNTYGQATPPPGLTNAVAIAAGGWHSLALLAEGTVVGWGNNYYGQLYEPSSLTNAIAIAAGDAFSLGLRAGGPYQRVRFSAPARGNGAFSVSLPTRSGRVYRLEYINAAGQNNWLPLPLVAGRADDTVLRDSTGGSSQRFYRARQW